MRRPTAIAPPKGKLGVLTVGMGAVATTFMAGVDLVRQGRRQPVGSLTQLGTIRLGKRTEGRTPAIKDFVPLASLEDLVFGGWDIFPDSAYEAAANAAVLSPEDLAKAKKFLSGIRPMKAAFDRNYVKRLDGPHVKKGQDQIRPGAADQGRHRALPEENQSLARRGDLVRLDGNFPQAARRALDAGEIRGGDEGKSSGHRALHALRLGGDHLRRALRQRRAQPHRRYPRDAGTGAASTACPSAARTSRPARRC